MVHGMLTGMVWYNYPAVEKKFLNFFSSILVRSFLFSGKSAAQQAAAQQRAAEQQYKEMEKTRMLENV